MAATTAGLTVQRRSAALRTLATVVLGVLVLAVGIEFIAGIRGSASAVQFVGMIAYRLPLFFYLGAILTIRRAFARLATGAVFDRVVPHLLTRVGWALGLGAFVNVFVTPNLLRLLAGSGGGPYANFDPAAITLGVVGLLLVVLARLFAQATAMRAELDGFL